MDRMLEQIDSLFPLRPIDPGEYDDFRASPLRVQLEWYEAEGLGNVSLLNGRAMGGLMKMQTLVINAVNRDAPLFSYDYINALGAHTALCEYYDTMLEPDAFDLRAAQAVKADIASLPDKKLGEHWYDGIKLSPSFAKKTKKSALPALDNACSAALKGYLAAAKQRPLLDNEQTALKRGKTADYVDGLFENGGPSTDAFVKALGRERARDLFWRIVFGVDPT